MPVIRHIKEREHKPITDEVLKAVYGKGYYVVNSPPVIPEPQDVYVKLTKTGEEVQIIGYACAECQLYHSPLVYACGEEKGRKAAYEAAKHCCHRLCSDCGKDMFEPGKKPGACYTCCEECRNKKFSEAEKSRYDKAKKVSAKEYNGRLCMNDEFFTDWYEIAEKLQEDYDLDDLLDGNIPVVYACQDIPFKMYANDIIESALEDHYEDASGQISQKSETRLQRMLDKWCYDQEIVSWECDMGLVVVPEKNFWVDGFICSHRGCSKDAKFYHDDGDGSILACDDPEHQLEYKVYQELPKIGE
jgi:hypothetical protein